MPPHVTLGSQGKAAIGNNMRCSLCQFVLQSKTFTSFATEQTFQIKNYINCSSTHIIYVINCNACRLQYVGCTIGKMKTHINEHKYATKSSMSFPCNRSSASKHFLHEHNGDISHLIGIKKVHKPKRGGRLG